MHASLAIKAIDYLISKDQPVFIWGPPGVGKSDSVRQIARARNWPVIDYRAAIRDPVDIRGLPAADMEARRAVWLAPSDLPDEARDGPEGLLFLDELNTAAPSVQAACFGLVLDRKVGDYRLPPGWRVIAAGNRQADRAAAQRMPSALANRFAHIDFDVSIDSWAHWANAADIDPVMVAFLRFRPELLHKMEGSDLRAFPTPRSWTRVAQLTDAPEDIRQSLVASHVGEGPAGEFEAFCRMYRSIPPIKTLIGDPKGAPVPTEPSMRFAVAVALARVAKRDNFEAILTYGGRLPKEFAIVLVVDAVKRDATLLETKSFVNWARANQDVSL